ncbi:MAG: RNA polymerase sigma factor, partial [Patescibacteria group bacterium]|nr:RNA polymerase sigma factor [Patescibacteria group bacterium]
SLEILIKKYLTKIYNFVFSIVLDKDCANDVTQDVFVKVWKNLKKFKKNKNFKTWLYAIARNTSIDYLRKKKNINFSDLENDENENILEKIPSEELLADEILEIKNLAEILQDAINNLSEKYRTVLLLHYKNDLTFDEISKIIKKPIDTVKSQYRRALILLRKLIINKN